MGGGVKNPEGGSEEVNRPGCTKLLSCRVPKYKSPTTDPSKKMLIEAFEISTTNPDLEENAVVFL